MEFLFSHISIGNRKWNCVFFSSFFGADLSELKFSFSKAIRNWNFAVVFDEKIKSGAFRVQWCIDRKIIACVG